MENNAEFLTPIPVSDINKIRLDILQLRLVFGQISGEEYQELKKLFEKDSAQQT